MKFNKLHIMLLIIILATTYINSLTLASNTNKKFTTKITKLIKSIDIFTAQGICQENGSKCDSPRDCCVGLYCDKYNSDRCLPE